MEQREERVALVGALVTRSFDAEAAVPTPTGWNLVFSDDFTGPANTGVNTANWQYTTGTSYPGGPAAFGTGEIETMTASTANVSLDVRSVASLTSLPFIKVSACKIDV